MANIVCHRLQVHFDNEGIASQIKDVLEVDKELKRGTEESERRIQVNGACLEITIATYDLKLLRKKTNALYEDLHLIVGTFERDALCSIPREQLKCLFQVFDVEGCGNMDARELKAALRALGIPATSEQIRILFQALDKSVEENITMEEFYSIAEGHLPQRKSVEAYRQTFAILGGFDSATVGGDEDGELTLAHLRRIRDTLQEDISDNDLEMMIAEADLDGDGRVTFEDFMRIMQLKNELIE